MTNSQNDTREAVADIQHAIWAHWMRYQFSVCQQNDDGSLTIPAEKVERWQRQIDTDYAGLSEREKDSDRDQADKVLGVLGNVDAIKALQRRWQMLEEGGDPKATMEEAIGIYNEAQGLIKALEEMQAGIKTLVNEIFAELSITDFEGSAGKARVANAYTRTSYDTKGLDKLASERPDIGLMLEDYRKVTEVPGSVRIS